MSIMGLTRIRNEELILPETLDHFAAFCDAGILVYDDCSDDGSVELCRAHPAVTGVLEGDVWSPDRVNENTRHRHLLLEEGRKHNPDWFLLFDADERIEWDFKDYDDYDSVVMKLYDFYITPEDADVVGTDRKWLGPEYRQIVMMFRNLPYMRYHYRGQRIIDGYRRPLFAGYVKHYGKAISVEEWEKTCDYYINFPEPFRSKWQARKGKAVHVDMKSDFDRPLITWDEREGKGVEIDKLPKYRDLQIIPPIHPHPSEPTRSVSGDKAPYRPKYHKAPERSSDSSLRILMAVHHLDAPTGDEIALLTLVRALRKAGHQITIASTEKGTISGILEEEGIKVTDNFESLYHDKFDIIHAHHNLNAILARHFYPETPLVFQSQNILADLSRPPGIDIGVSTHIVNSEEMSTLWQHTYGLENCELIRHGIDTSRFTERRPIGSALNKTLILSNFLIDSKVEIMAEACRKAGVELSAVGAGSTVVLNVEDYVNEVDLVVTSGRGVVEAMACGRAVIVYSAHGADGMITPENFEASREFGFSGRAIRREFTVETFIKELAQYNLAMGEINSSLVRTDHDMENQVGRYEQIYEKALSEGGPKQRIPVPAAELMHFQKVWNQYRSVLSQATSLASENKRLSDEISNLQPKMQALMAKVNQERQQLLDEIKQLKENKT